MIYIYHCDNN